MTENICYHSRTYYYKYTGLVEYALDELGHSYLQLHDENGIFRAISYPKQLRILIGGSVKRLLNLCSLKRAIQGVEFAENSIPQSDDPLKFKTLYPERQVPVL
jgi:hypothetical protein